MTDPDSSSTWKWVVGIVLGVPATILAVLQLSDRFSDDASPPTSTQSASVHSSPSGTADPGPSPTSAWSPPDVPDSPAELPQADYPSAVAQPPSPPTSEAPPAISSVDRIQIETWAYDPAGPPNTYIADNDGGKKIKVSWTSSAGGYEVNGGCTSSVRIQGPDTDHAETSSNCSDSMGTYFDVQQPGNYTVTVTTYQKSGAQHSDSIPVAIQ